MDMGRGRLGFQERAAFASDVVAENKSPFVERWYKRCPKPSSGTLRKTRHSAFELREPIVEKPFGFSEEDLAIDLTHVRTKEPTGILGYDIPQELNFLDGIIKESRGMLELGDDWDGEGSPGYSENTWIRAIRFLLRNALYLWDSHKIVINAPEIGHGPEGSIDIYWQAGLRKLLINVPADEQQSSTFYGYDNQGVEVKGNLNLQDANQWLMMWQME